MFESAELGLSRAVRPGPPADLHRPLLDVAVCLVTTAGHLMSQVPGLPRTPPLGSARSEAECDGSLEAKSSRMQLRRGLLKFAHRASRRNLNSTREA